MARSDTDTWDLASSVGATATMVAAARALATEDTDPIINDPFAAPLVRAVGIEFFTRVVDGEIDPALTKIPAATAAPNCRRKPTRLRCAPGSSTSSSPTRPRRASARR